LQQGHRRRRRSHVRREGDRAGGVVDRELGGRRAFGRDRGVADAARSTGVDVQDWTASVEEGEIVEYKANVKIAFAVENEEDEADEDEDTRKRKTTRSDGVSPTLPRYISDH
jgi:hypothetical protein